MRAFADPRAFRDNGGRMDPRRITWLLIKKLERVGKREIGIRRAQRGKRRKIGMTHHLDAFVDQNRGGKRGMEQRKVPAIREECYLPRFGILHSSHPANLEFRRAFQAASQFLRDFSKFHGECSSVVCEAVCESRTGQRGKYSRAAGLLVEKAGLGRCGCSGGRLSARDAYDTNTGHFPYRAPPTKHKITIRHA